MRRFMFLIGTVAVTVLGTQSVEAKATDTTEKAVRGACKGRMQSSGSAFGCTVIDQNGHPMDWGCITEKGKQTCTVLTRTPPKPGKGVGGANTGATTGTTTTPTTGGNKLPKGNQSGGMQNLGSGKNK
jgi:hypothetical protein